MIWPAFRSELSGIVEVDFTSTSTTHGWKGYCPGQTSGGAIAAAVTRSSGSGTAPEFSSGDAATRRLDGSAVAVPLRRRRVALAGALADVSPPRRRDRDLTLRRRVAAGEEALLEPRWDPAATQPRSFPAATQRRGVWMVVLSRSRSVDGGMHWRVPSPTFRPPEKRQGLNAASPRRRWGRSAAGTSVGSSSDAAPEFSNGDAATRRLDGSAVAVPLRRRRDALAGALVVVSPPGEETGT
jgi:hypothetical protein